MITSALRKRGQMGHAAQATYQSAVDLHKAVMSNICEALNRPIGEVHPDIAAVPAAKTDLLVDWPTGMTFIGWAAALNRAWNNIEGTLTNAGHRLRGNECGVWHQDLNSLRTQSCRWRFGICV